MSLVQLNMAAERVKCRRNEELQSEIDHLLDRRRLLIMRSNSQTNNTVGVLNKVSAFKMSGEELEFLDHRLQEAYDLSTQLLESTTVEPSPKAPDLITQELLHDALPTVVKGSQLPSWMKHICYHRDRFVSVAICKGDGVEIDTPVVPMICLQQPLEITWHKLIRLHPFGREQQELSQYADFSEHSDITAFRFSDEFCMDTEVLPSILYMPY